MDRKEAYHIAIRAEIRSQILYRALSNSFRNADTKSVFKGLINMEEGHEIKVRDAFQKEFPGEEIKVEGNFDSKSPDLDHKDPQSVLEYAISREEVAQENYIRLAQNSKDYSLKEMFLHFAAEENGHITLLLALIDQLNGAQIWYDPSELDGLMED